jgi:hypothetical protein
MRARTEVGRRRVTVIFRLKKNMTHVKPLRPVWGRDHVGLIVLANGTAANEMNTACATSRQLTLVGSHCLETADPRHRSSEAVLTTATHEGRSTFRKPQFTICIILTETVPSRTSLTASRSGEILPHPG